MLKEKLTRVKKRLLKHKKLILGLFLVKALIVLNIFGHDLRIKLLNINHIDTLEQKTVKITELTKSHGGSGTIVYSSDTLSVVLTNRHVCGVIVNGGLVTKTNQRSYAVDSFHISETHDLCLVRVSKNLNANTNLSNNPPSQYDEISVSGHPNLLPHVITKGHVSDRANVAIFKELAKCDETKTDEMYLKICAFFGGMPTFEYFDATLVSATIMPGSSGSGVFNEKNELVAVVFAGRGELSYGYVVPYEYVKRFIDEELYLLLSQQKNWTKVDNTQSLFQSIAQNSLKNYEVLVNKCKTNNLETIGDIYIKDFCKKITQSIYL